MFDFALVEQAMAQPRLRQPLPTFLPSNRGGRTRVIPEDELNKPSRAWFDELERKIAFYREHGIDNGWLHEWSAKYFWSWLARHKPQRRRHARWRDQAGGPVHGQRPFRRQAAAIPL